MPKPFRIGLRRLRSLSPKSIYRFRRKVKRLRVYLALYNFPADPPSNPALDKLFRRAGKLRQAYLHMEWLQTLAPEWKKAAKAEIKYRKRRLRKVLKPSIKEVQKAIMEWEKRFPEPWTTAEGMQLWQDQGRHWTDFHKEKLRAFPPPPYTSEQLHDLRTLLRKWELAGYWADLPESPPKGLATLLGEARDLYLLQKWLRKVGAEDSLLETVQNLQEQKTTEALVQWETWRSS